MTIQEAITNIDTIKPNSYTDAMKIKWLSDLDLMVYQEILSTHEDAPAAAFTGYTDDTDKKTELLVPAPYDDVYRSYLEKEIDRANGETAKYNNSVTLFNNAYIIFMNWYNRNYLPVQNSNFFRF